MTILVTGATGAVGRHVVGQLRDAGRLVRALTRDPDRAALPDGVEVVRGDLTDPASFAAALDGVEALHLITFGGADYAPLENGPELVALAAAAGVRRISVLGGWTETSVEPALRAGPIGWTRLEPVEFMSGALEWAPQIRAGDVVRLCATFPSAVVHEADIAAVAVAALTEDGHAGRSYRITGPAALTPRERVAQIAAATGRDLVLEELTPAEERERLRGLGYPDDIVEFGIELATAPPSDAGETAPTVREVTGRPGRTFAEWARENAAAFRPVSVRA